MMTNDSRQLEIVIAEDNPADLALVRTALRTHQIDAEFHVFRDGEKTISFLDSLNAEPKKPRVDLLILDMYLPRRNGQEILKHLWSMERYAGTPVILMTALAPSRISADAPPHAVLFYFRKPMSLDEFMELGALVRNVLIQTTQPGSTMDSHSAGGNN